MFDHPHWGNEQRKTRAGDTHEQSHPPYCNGFFLAQACSDSEPTDGAENETVEPIVQAELYDFDAAAPWFECPSQNFPAEATVIPALEQAYQRFGTENTRDVQSNVSFPESGSWAQIGMIVKLECPETGLCDHWDRSASVQLITNPDAEPENQERVELARFITPYKIEMCQYIDVTAMAPLLKGNRAITSWIDTWVGEGHAQGEGWRTSVSFVFYPGTDARPKEIINVWSRRSITVGEVEADANVPSQVTPFTFLYLTFNLEKSKPTSQQLATHSATPKTVLSFAR